MPASYAAANRPMRLSPGKRALLIVALCIEQQTAEEKSGQVASLARVYVNATANLIYLGEDKTGAAPAVGAALHRLANKAEEAAPLPTGGDLRQ